MKFVFPKQSYINHRANFYDFSGTDWVLFEWKVTDLAPFLAWTRRNYIDKPMRPLQCSRSVPQIWVIRSPIDSKTSPGTIWSSVVFKRFWQIVETIDSKPLKKSAASRLKKTLLDFARGAGPGEVLAWRRNTDSSIPRSQVQNNIFSRSSWITPISVL